MITTLTLWTNDELAGGTQVTRLEWTALTYGDALDHTAGITATVVADEAIRQAVYPGLVVQVDSDRGTWTAVITDVQWSLEAQTLVLRGAPVLHDLARVPLRDATGATSFTLANKTAAEFVTAVVRPSLDAEGYTWVTLGDAWDATAVRTWTGNQSVLAWVTAEAARAGVDVLWSRRTTDALLTIGARGGTLRTAFAGINVRAVDRASSTEAEYGNVVQMVGANAGTTAVAWWPVAGVDGTKVRLRARNGTLPVLESGQYVGDGTARTPTVWAEFLRLSQSPVDVIRVAITGSVAPDTLIFGSAPTVAADDQVRFVGSSTGAELPTVSLEPAIRTSRRARRSVAASGTTGDVNVHRNGRLRDWTGSHAAVDWTFPATAITTPPTGASSTVQADGAQVLVGAIAGVSISGSGGGGGFDPALLTGTWTPSSGTGEVLTPGWRGTATLSYTDLVTAAPESVTADIELVDPALVGWPSYGVLTAGVSVSVVVRLAGTVIPVAAGLYGLSGTWTLSRVAVPAPAPQSFKLKGLTAGDTVIAGDTVAGAGATLTVTVGGVADGAGKLTVSGTVNASGTVNYSDGANVTLTRIRAGEPVGGPWVFEPRWTAPDAGTWTSSAATTSGTQVTPPAAVNATWTQEVTGLPAGTILEPGDGVTCTAWHASTAYQTALVRRRAIADGSGTVLVSLWHPSTAATTMSAPTLGDAVTVRRPDPAVIRAHVTAGLSAASLYRFSGTIPTTTLRLWPTPTRSTFRVTLRGWYWNPLNDFTAGPTLATFQLRDAGTPVGTPATVVPSANIPARTLHEWTASQTYTVAGPKTLTLDLAGLNVDAHHASLFVSGIDVSLASSAPDAIDEFGGGQALYAQALAELGRAGRPAVTLRLELLEDAGRPIAVGDDVLVDVPRWGTRDRVRVVRALYRAWRTTAGTAAEASPELELVTQRGTISATLATAGVFT